MKNNLEMNGAEAVIKALEENGVEIIFGYPGGAVLPLYDALFKNKKIKHILVRHEQAAVHAAEGYARSTGKVGCVLVTSGPGATNAITGLTDALMDSVPLICLTGQVPTHLIGTDAFQEADTTGISRPCTKHNYLVKNVDLLCNIVHEAFTIASSGRPGPVLIDLPKDIQLSNVTYKNKIIKTNKVKENNKSLIDLETISSVAKVLFNAKKPIIYGGGGVVNAGPEASALLTELVDLLNAPVTLTLMGLGSVSNENKNFLGMLGMHGTYEANLAMHNCDVMLNVGARFDDRVTGRLNAFAPFSKKIHIDIDKSSINKIVSVDYGLVGDAKEILYLLIKEIKKEKKKKNNISINDWWLDINGWRNKKSLNFEQKGKVIGLYIVAEGGKKSGIRVKFTGHNEEVKRFQFSTRNKSPKRLLKCLHLEAVRHGSWHVCPGDVLDVRVASRSGTYFTQKEGNVEISHPDANAKHLICGCLLEID